MIRHRRFAIVIAAWTATVFLLPSCGVKGPLTLAKQPASGTTEKPAQSSTTIKPTADATAPDKP
jgi:predicted small lipoprotein YifL